MILAALIIAFNSLGLSYITDLLGRIAWFLPKVIVAVLILAFGAYFARFIGHTVIAYCRNVEIQDAELLGRIAQYAILAFVVLIALDQMDFGGRDPASELPDHPFRGRPRACPRVRPGRPALGRRAARALVAEGQAEGQVSAFPPLSRSSPLLESIHQAGAIAPRPAPKRLRFTRDLQHALLPAVS